MIPTAALQKCYTKKYYLIFLQKTAYINNSADRLDDPNARKRKENVIAADLKIDPYKDSERSLSNELPIDSRQLIR